MNTIHNPESVHPPVGSYSHAIEVPPNARWLFVAGQVALSPEGGFPETFAEQCEQAWTNLYRVLESAGMSREDLVKLTIFLTREDDLPTFREVRDRVLGSVRPATTLVFIRALARPEWRVEIEGMAAKA
ncbi:MAG: RidA family protein [Armatimonadetes bacterium]|nr:RidA family protein [Armatimonadota bacterium]